MQSKELGQGAGDPPGHWQSGATIAKGDSGGPDIQPILSCSPPPPIPCQTHQGSLRENEELAPPRPPGRKGATHWPQDGTMPSDFLALLTVEREREKAFATSPMGDHS